MGGISGLQEGQRLVVIGSSFISMELVVAVSKRKLASIDVIAMENYPFERVLGVEVGKGLKKACFLYTLYEKATNPYFKVPRKARDKIPPCRQSDSDTLICVQPFSCIRR